MRDMSADGAVVGSCSASVESCPFVLYGDRGAKEVEVHHLVAQTVSGGDVVAEGASKDVTFIPFQTKAQIRSITSFEPVPGSASAGTVAVAIKNADPRPGSGHVLYLEARDMAVAKPKWSFVGGCQQDEPLDCEIEYLAGPNDPPGQPREIQFRAVVSYENEVRDRSAVKSIKLFHGINYDEMMAIAPTAEAALCGIIVAANQGPTMPGTTVPWSVAACAGLIAGGPALALYYFLRDADPAVLGEVLASVLNAIRESTLEVAVPTSGSTPGAGPCPTTSGKDVYDRQIEAIAMSLRRLNQGVEELTLATARAVAAACLATAGFHRISVLTGVAFWPGFCKKPSMPFFIVGADVNEAAQHDFDAIFGHVGKGLPARPGWAVLNYSSRAVKKAAGQNPSWGSNSEACLGKTGGDTGNDCDEYPYFSTQQGGKHAVPTPSLRPVNSVQNRREGRRLNHTLLQRCGLQSATGITKTSNGSGGDAYVVLPMPLTDLGLSDVGSLIWQPILSHAPLTFGICNRGGGGGPSSS